MAYDRCLSVRYHHRQWEQPGRVRDGGWSVEGRNEQVEVYYWETGIFFRSGSRLVEALNYGRRDFNVIEGFQFICDDTWVAHAIRDENFQVIINAN